VVSNKHTQATVTKNTWFIDASSRASTRQMPAINLPTATPICRLAGRSGQSAATNHPMKNKQTAPRTQVQAWVNNKHTGGATSRTNGHHDPGTVKSSCLAV